MGNELCLGGEKYHQLFKKRVVDFVEKDGVGYYKWDGIQFSCSEPDHGHPVGIYSRRAVMDSLIELCQAVRNKNPDVFLNITSGTWLSPWWVKYANQIWMQGSDYGYANVPSISQRDAAITYRDFVLFDDLCEKKFWFPIANLMTHGIIKGSLQQLGGEEEPLDKFTDNALLYFARGVSMWELYISPDLLTDGEWNSIAKAIHWAKDRFPILKSTEMIGGDPGKREAYAYVHFSGKHGIIAARNPFIEPKPLRVKLSPAQGLDPDAATLVVERVYPTKWVSPQIYAAGATLALLLEPDNSNKTDNPDVKSNLDGKSVALKIEQQREKWKWVKVDVKQGKHKARFIISAREKKQQWKGKAALWLICREKPEGAELLFELSEIAPGNHPMPPHPWPPGEIRRNIKIGEGEITG